MEDKKVHKMYGGSEDGSKRKSSFSINQENVGKYFQAGDEAALHFVYEQLHPVLSLYANRLINDRCAAEEIASEAIIRTWKFHYKLDSYATIRSYHYTTTGRLCYQYMAKERKRNKVLHDTPLSLSTETFSIFDEIVRNETYHLLRSVIETLPAGSRKVITMQFLEGKTTREIATELQLSPSTIKTQKAQGLTALRKKLMRPLLVLLSLFTVHLLTP